jgi:ABC-type Fe3+-hydroxamate transport system substrate-binding protein
VRLVSLCPSITETLIDFGLAAQLVGITRYCIRPKDVTRGLPRVGGTKDPDLDAIRKARPDLVFLNEEENTKEAYEALALELRVDTTFPRRVSDVPRVLRHLGDLTGTRAIAESRARELERALEALAARPKRSFRFAYLVWRDPWMTVNADTYVSDLFQLAGGSNVYADASERYPTIGLDDLAQRRCDLVLLPDEPFHFKERDRAEILPLVPGAKVELVSGDDCCWHGVRSIEGVRLAERLTC